MVCNLYLKRSLIANQLNIVDFQSFNNNNTKKRFDPLNIPVPAKRANIHKMDISMGEGSAATQNKLQMPAKQNKISKCYVLLKGQILIVICFIK
jgi:hypothetical protein